MKLSTSQWIVINEIIYKMNTCNDFQKLRCDFIRDLDCIIDFDKGTFYVSNLNCTENRLTHPVALKVKDCSNMGYEDFEDYDYTRWLFNMTTSMVVRETDYFEESFRQNNVYFQEFYIPRDIHYALFLSLAYNEEFLGIVSLFRAKEKSDFTDEDVFILEMLKSHLAYRLFQFKDHTNFLNNIEDRYFKEEPFTIDKNFIEHFKLTKRESEILSFIIENKLNEEEIANQLFISLFTLKKHISNIYQKLHVNNRMQLIRVIKEYQSS